MALTLQSSSLRSTPPISSLCFFLFLALPSAPSLAHTGHGDEFNQALPSQGVNTISVDTTTAQQIGLTVEPVTRQFLAFGIRTVGQIETAPNHRVEVTNPVGGMVIQLLVEPGDKVEAGQGLARITSGELAELRIAALENFAERQGDIQQAQTNLKLAQQNYDRHQKMAQTAITQAQTELRIAQEQFDRDQELMEQGALARRDFLESEAHLASAQQAVTEAESRLAVLAAQAEVEHAQTALQVAQSRAQLSAETYQTRLRQLGAEANPDGTITIRAPIAGTIADREVTLGQSAQDAGSILMTIVDDRTVLATANLYEKDVEKITQGQAVRVTVSSVSDRMFEGKITTIGSTVDGESRVLAVSVALENTQGSLKPGMFAELEILTEQTPEPVVAIPQSAILEINGRSIVFVQNGTSFQPVEVTLGRQSGNWVEVTQGVFEGDWVVTQRANQLYAQSLRSRPSEPETTPTPTASPSIDLGQGFPRWAIFLGSGIVIGGTFISGALWSSAHNRSSGRASLTSFHSLDE